MILFIESLLVCLVTFGVGIVAMVAADAVWYAVVGTTTPYLALTASVCIVYLVAGLFAAWLDSEGRL